MEKRVGGVGLSPPARLQTLVEILLMLKREVI